MRIQSLMFVAATVLCAALAPTLSAQVVRGRVLDRSSSAPVPGVLVSLVPDDTASVSTTTVLSNARGEYAIRAPSPGRYHLDAKRIGVQRYLSDVFQLATGESKVLDISLDAVQRLPEVRVVESDLCVLDESQRTRVASLWDEARSVLTAARISLRDRLFEGQLTRYVRGLHPRTLRVLEESWGEHKGMMDRPFVGMSPDSLAYFGYRRTVGDYEYYYAPDAEVLLSRSFGRDHCYRAIEGARDRRGLVGIAFQPAPRRVLPEVSGTMWLDARTFELRFVEFRYTQLPAFEGADKVGGEVHFGKLDNGAWVTSRWFLRFPQFARPVAPVETYSRVPSVLVRPTMHRLVEEGGMVFTAGLKLFERPAAVSGTVLDSAGRPFAGVTVRLGGAPFRTTSDANGRFRMDSLPAGRFTVIAEHASYAQLGSFIGDESVELREAADATMSLRAPRTSELVERLCGGKLPRRDNGTLRLHVVDSLTSRPLPSLRVWLRWTGRYVGSMERVESLSPTAAGGTESMTDASGAVTFCDVPADVSLVFSAIRPDGKPASDSTLHRLGRNELKAGTVRTRRPQ
ncbi:MAG TPA: carboxypeptidase regulatory-like domain-containing protein [Gemmatimonadaceae bacterium]